MGVWCSMTISATLLTRLTRGSPDIQSALGRMSINSVELLLLKRAIAQRAEALFDLRPAAGTHERAGNGRLSKHPCDRHLRQTLPTWFGDLVERAHMSEIGFGEHRLAKRLVLNRARGVWDAVEVFC